MDRQSPSVRPLPGVTNGHQLLRRETRGERDEPVPDPFPEDRTFLRGGGHDLETAKQMAFAFVNGSIASP